MRLQQRKEEPDRRGCEGKLPRPPNVELGMKRRERGLETGGRGYAADTNNSGARERES